MPLSGRLERFSQPELDLWPRHCTCNNGRAQSVSCRSYPFAFVSQKCASSFKRSDIRARRTPPPLASEQGRSEFRGLSVSGARTYSAASGIIRISTVLAPTLNVPARYLQPRLSREFPASASVPTAELRMFQPIFPYDLRRFISFHISVFFCRPSHFSFTNLVRSLAVARAGLHSVFLLSSLRCRKAITLASFSSLRPHF